MRSRYAAYALGHLDHVFRTWHPRTRPDEVTPSPGWPGPGWRSSPPSAGGPDDDTGEVEFRAHYRTPAGDGVLHERSRFERRAGRWVYVDGDVEPRGSAGGVGDHGHDAGGVLDDRGGHRAVDQVRDRAPAVRADDDHLHLLRGVDQAVVRETADAARRARRPRGTSRPGR